MYNYIIYSTYIFYIYYTFECLNAYHLIYSRTQNLKMWLGTSSSSTCSALVQNAETEAQTEYQNLHFKRSLRDLC